MKTFATLFLAIIFVTGCKSASEPKSIVRITVDLKTANAEDIADVFTKIDTIELEATQESLIGNITRITVVGDTIFVWDMPNKLLAFSEAGEFLYNIGAKGRAHNEYIGVNDYFIKGDTINLLDFMGSKVLRFKTNGEHIDNHPLGISYIDKIWPMPNDGYIALHTYGNKEDEPKFVWLDDRFDIIRSSEERRINTLSLPNTFSQNGDDMIFWELLNDTIYSIGKERVVPKYIVDFAEYSIPSYIHRDLDKVTEYYMNNSSETAGIINQVIETTDAVAFMFAHDMAVYWALFEKQSGKTRVFRLAEIGQSLGRLDPIIAYENGRFYGVYTPHELNSNDNQSLIRFGYGS